MSRRWCAAAVLAAMLVCPAPAFATGGWGWPVDGAPSLDYGAKYADPTGRTCTHGGLDIAASAGQTVRACAAGEVVFSGLVPAGEGERTWAVTVRLPDGLRYTCLPLSSVKVRNGQPVSSGDDLGLLSGTGDASGGGSHLHLGVKRGDASLDPSAFLGARGTPTAGVGPVAAAGGTGQRSGSTPRSGTARVAGQRASAPSAEPLARPGTLLDPEAALGQALRALARPRPLARIEPVAAPATLSFARAKADVTALQSEVSGWLVRLGLLLVAGACVWPVLRVAKAGATPLSPVPSRRAR